MSTYTNPYLEGIFVRSVITIALFYPFFYFYIEITDFIAQPDRLLRIGDITTWNHCLGAGATELVNSGSATFWITTIITIGIIFLRRRKLRLQGLLTTYVLIYFVVFVVPTFVRLISLQLYPPSTTNCIETEYHR